MEPIVVVGGGIAGLGAAWTLRKQGLPVLVLEAWDQVGGVVRSRRLDDGTVLDLGPQTLSTRDPELLATLEEVGLRGRRLEASHEGARRYVVHDGAPVALPSGPVGLLRTPLLSAQGKLRLLSEPFRGSGSGNEEAREGSDESVAAFARRRLGPEVAARLVDPFVSGVYAGDPEALSVAAVLPELQMMEREHGSLLRGGLERLWARRGGNASDDDAEAAARRSRICSFDEGLQAWPIAVARALGPDTVRTGTRVEGITPRSGSSGQGWRVHLSGSSSGANETVDARAVVLAVPAAVTASLLEGLGERASSPPHPLVEEGIHALTRIPYAPVTLVHLIWRRDRIAHSLDGFGLLAPSREGRTLLGSLWPDTIFPDRNRTDRVVTVNFVGGARTPDRALVPDEPLVAEVLRELEDLLGARGEPELALVTRWPRAIPQYTRGHLDRIAAVARVEEALPGLRLIGNWRGGVSLGAAWEGGRKAARGFG